MPAFQDAQQKLSQTRTVQDEAERALFQTGEELKRVTSALEQSQRSFDANSDEAIAERREFERRKEALEGQKRERHSIELAHNCPICSQASGKHGPTRASTPAK
jgi:septal ring factor EnvC (AmiA/AmiB activator)